MKFIAASSMAIVLLALVSGCKEKPIDFSAQVKPILNKHCISCHGGVKRNANYSVLFRDEALDTTESGKVGIVPGDPEHSEMIRRITSNDPEVRMPYKEAPLEPQEIRILTKWIEQGAPWGDHWAYVAPQPVSVPKPGTLAAGIFSAPQWAENEIDFFVLQKLEEQKLGPSPAASKSTLMRRVYMDLIGLPPTEQQARVFMNDTSYDAYEKLVDDLLASPRFGEKWATWWLDMARYSDTKGYERDAGRTIWRYRDWVIRALNADMPFDQFSTEQLAGDLLANPSDDQLIATAFHRNTMTNDEGGTEDEEFRVAAVVDRVSTTWEIWQSTTMGCVQCHTHPYDPFLHEEYYKSLAFFNNTHDEDTHSEHPNLRTYSQEDEAKLASIKAWVNDHAGQEAAMGTAFFLKTLEPKYHPHDFDAFVNGELIDTKWLGIRPEGSARLRNIRLDGKTALFINYWTRNKGGSVEIRLDNLNGTVIGRSALSATGGARKVTSIPLRAAEGKHDLYFVFNNASIPGEQPVCAIDWFAFRAPLPGENDPGYRDMRESFMYLLNAKAETTPVMVENDPDQHRTTYIFDRGNWLVKGAEVQPDVPGSLNPFPEGQPYNRLGFSRWLFSKDNPLTARATVNRFWEQIFGTGLVETPEDFGTQGVPPTHGELLDWMALRLMHEHKWSVKKLLREMVMSATYRQDSRIRGDNFEKDPSNRFLSRGPRVRLPAEQLRDQALAVSGLLSDKMYGKSVMPFQPQGIWNSVYNGERWKESKGDDRYRRSVYTYAKRTSPYPAFMMFDGSSREVCVGRRLRTNTPLQALVTLNDSTFVVAARHLAQKMLDKGKDPGTQIRAGYKALLVTDMPAEKVEIFKDLYVQAFRKYSKDQEAARLLSATEDGSPQLAAMTVVANAMMNLDEVIMKE
jgi:hypothetical protein